MLLGVRRALALLWLLLVRLVELFYGLRALLRRARYHHIFHLIHFRLLRLPGPLPQRCPAHLLRLLFLLYIGAATHLLRSVVQTRPGTVAILLLLLLLLVLQWHFSIPSWRRLLLGITLGMLRLRKVEVVGEIIKVVEILYVIEGVEAIIGVLVVVVVVYLIVSDVLAHNIDISVLMQLHHGANHHINVVFGPSSRVHPHFIELYGTYLLLLISFLSL